MIQKVNGLSLDLDGASILSLFFGHMEVSKTWGWIQIKIIIQIDSIQIKPNMRNLNKLRGGMSTTLNMVLQVLVLGVFK